MLSASILVKEAAPTRTKISDIELNKCQAYVGRSAKTSRAAIRCEAEGDWVSWNRAWGSSIQFSAPQTCQCIHTRRKKKRVQRRTLLLDEVLVGGGDNVADGLADVVLGLGRHRLEQTLESCLLTLLCIGCL